MKDWELATDAEVEERRKDVAAAARLISSSPMHLLEGAELHTAREFGMSWGHVSELVAFFMCRLAEQNGTET